MQVTPHGRPNTTFGRGMATQRHCIRFCAEWIEPGIGADELLMCWLLVLQVALPALCATTNSHRGLPLPRELRTQDLEHANSTAARWARAAGRSPAWKARHCSAPGGRRDLQLTGAAPHVLIAQLPSG